MRFVVTPAGDPPSMVSLSLVWSILHDGGPSYHSHNVPERRQKTERQSKKDVANISTRPILARVGVLFRSVLRVHGELVDPCCCFF